LKKSNIIDDLLNELEKRGMSIYEFSKQTGIPKTRIYAWKEGRGHPKAEDTNTITTFVTRETINATNEPEPTYQQKRPGFIETGKHPAIVSKQLFEAVQVKLNRKTPVRHGNDEVYLRGVLHSEQGYKLTAGKSKGRSKLYWYYVDHKNKISYPAEQLHRQFEDMLKLCSFTPDELTWLKKRVAELVAEKTDNGAERSEDIRKQLQLVEKQIKSIQTKYLTTDSIDEPTYRNIITGYFEKRTQLNDEVASFEINAAQINEAIDLVLGKMVNLYDAFMKLPLEGKHKMINTLFGGFLYYSRNSYRTAFLSPLLQPKAALLKENGLLVVEQPVIKMGVTPMCAPNRSIIEPLQELALIFAA
jgi:hypothetical protein